MFDGDDLESTLHFGLFLKDEIVAIASFMKNKNDLLKSKNQYQLRGMAVLKKVQGMGFGKKILAFGEKALKAEDIETVWCNARKVAVNFYNRNGYEIIGKPFNIEGIGTHYVMFKNLQ
ncbi:GNAT family N-acetyltransferase [Hyunsoonleella rubra]|uniref:GNAT family N-acetyltransferase n=1 Tax=Hyunsoonleella rubra TaxID=1737062 RepID=A0ABW5TBI3_9FLAO